MEIGEGLQEVVSEMVDVDIEILGEGKVFVILEFFDCVVFFFIGVGEIVLSVGVVEILIVVVLLVIVVFVV